MLQDTCSPYSWRVKVMGTFPGEGCDIGVQAPVFFLLIAECISIGYISHSDTAMMTRLAQSVILCRSLVSGKPGTYAMQTKSVGTYVHAPNMVGTEILRGLWEGSSVMGGRFAMWNFNFKWFNL